MNTQKADWQQSSEVFHKRANEYDSWFDDSLLFAIETAAINALSVPWASPALEIGVGPGRFAQELGSDFGIDPANAPLHLAAGRNIRVCQAVGEALPFGRNSFTNVSLFFALCFVQNPATVLKEAHRVLQKSGHLLLGIVPATGQWGKALLKKKKSGHPFYEHAHFFTLDEIAILVHNSGFFVHNSMSTLYQKPGSVSIVEKSRSGMDASAGFIALHLKKI